MKNLTNKSLDYIQGIFDAVYLDWCYFENNERPLDHSFKVTEMQIIPAISWEYGEGDEGGTDTYKGNAMNYQLYSLGKFIKELKLLFDESRDIESEIENNTFHERFLPDYDLGNKE